MRDYYLGVLMQSTRDWVTCPYCGCVHKRGFLESQDHPRCWDPVHRHGCGQPLNPGLLGVPEPATRYNADLLEGGVFLASAPDTAEPVGRIVARLLAKGIKVVTESQLWQNVPAHVSAMTAIEDAVRRAAYILVAPSPELYADSELQIIANYAIQYRKAIPILVLEGERGSTLLRTLWPADFTNDGDWEMELTKLVKAIVRRMDTRAA